MPSATPLTVPTILVIFIVHWLAAVFAQSFFLHRYGAHGQFQLSRFWERAFHLFTALVQGPSYLLPKAYARLHHEHHLYSDTPLDPHSPHQQPRLWLMMYRTLQRYKAHETESVPQPPGMAVSPPSWPLLDRVADGWPARLFWVVSYALMYAALAPNAWWWLLYPAHLMLGPIHGAIVNWCGHRYGYRNYEIDDRSCNTLPIDFLCMGELFQNNHHRHPMRADFGVKWFEIDPTALIISGLRVVGIIHKPGAKVQTSSEPRSSVATDRAPQQLQH